MIWCVEDDASIRDIEVYALQSTGFEAKGFEDGQVFWDALQKEAPELVILDVIAGARRHRASAAHEVLVRLFCHPRRHGDGQGGRIRQNSGAGSRRG